MVDKLILTTKEYRVRDLRKTGLLLAQGNVDMETGEADDETILTDSLGASAKGKKLFVNEKDFYSLDINSTGMRIIFNPSKMSHEYNLLNDVATLKTNCQHVLEDVANRGISFDKDLLRMSRIDLSKNRKVNLPISEYKPIFSCVKSKRERNQALYPDGYMTGNNSTGTIFYDKFKQLGIETDENMMRCEFQIKKHRSVVSVLKLDTLPYLYDAGMQHLSEAYSTQLAEKVFRNKEDIPQQTEMFGYETMLWALKKHKESEKRGILNFIINMNPMQMDLKQIGQLMKDAGYGRPTVSRNLAKARDIMHQRAFLLNNLGKDVIESQYRELYTKFVA